MKFSFIITSVGKDKELQKCVESIEKAYEYRKDIGIEILLVIQDSYKNKTVKTKYPELSSSYYISRTGLSAARNFAVKKSRGEYLVFIDDDAAVKEDFIDILSKNIGEADALCGRIMDPSDNRVFSRCFLDAEKKYLNRFKFRYFMGSSHIVKKSILEKIGLYDENFGTGARYRGAEESDIFFRMLRENRRILYLPDLIFYHPVTYKTPVARAFDYAYAVGAMLSKQTITDKRHFFIYGFLIIEIMLKSLFRSAQAFLFLNSIKIKNEQFQYRSAFKGTVSGIISYIGFRLFG